MRNVVVVPGAGCCGFVSVREGGGVGGQFAGPVLVFTARRFRSFHLSLGFVVASSEIGRAVLLGPNIHLYRWAGPSVPLVFIHFSHPPFSLFSIFHTLAPSFASNVVVNRQGLAVTWRLGWIGPGMHCQLHELVWHSFNHVSPHFLSPFPPNEIRSASVEDDLASW